MNIYITLALFQYANQKFVQEKDILKTEDSNSHAGPNTDHTTTNVYPHSDVISS